MKLATILAALVAATATAEQFSDWEKWAYKDHLATWSASYTKSVTDGGEVVEYVTGGGELYAKAYEEVAIVC